ncbi:MAG TPA: hypothetical protein VGR03_06250 [Candidatus Acidoferrum sp.]|nr:hypothetical protein [Candidatus Acidoferrum sp.]
MDASVVMPNHMHGIVIIFARARSRPCGMPLREEKKQTEFGKPLAGSLATIVRSFKAAVTKFARERRLIHAHPVWQRGYYERVIRTGEEYSDTSRYILVNPLRWGTDAENPDLKAK